MDNSDFHADTEPMAYSGMHGIRLPSLAGVPPAKNIKVTALVGGQK
ncbi:hypothetical protein KTQ42_08645|nr:hypothetical protein [Noviherbaspirillum sp. L7-7A]MBV0879370.1 hypothetical protein [Noviherbaspirillum sp. L7-7A]